MNHLHRIRNDMTTRQRNNHPPHQYQCCSWSKNHHRHLIVCLCLLIQMFHTSTAFLSTTTRTTTKHHHPAISIARIIPTPTKHDTVPVYSSYSNTSNTRMHAIMPNPIAGMSLRNILNAGGSVIDCTTAIPPIDYFLALIATGFGVPLSEDALCIFAGSTLPILPSTQARILLILHLYGGVVLSDVTTFLIGKALRTKILHRFSNSIQIIQEDESCDVLMDASNNNANEQEQLDCNKRQRRRDVLQRKIASAGDAIGFVTRLSFGMRAPLMLLAGFSNGVSLVNFVSGTLLGALVSLSLQLGVGWSLRMSNSNNNIMAAITAIGNNCAGVGVGVAVVAATLVMAVRRMRSGENDAS